MSYGPSSDQKKPSNSSSGFADIESNVESSETSSAQSFRMSIWLKVALLLIVVGLASVGYLTSELFPKPAPPQQTTQETDPEEIARRSIAPEAILTLAGGEQKKLSDFRGNVVILSFWASWCPPCLEELPTFAQLERRLGDRGLEVLPVNIEEEDVGQSFATKFWKSQNLPFPSFFDVTKKLVQDFEVSTLPANFVIDRNGRIVFSSVGANDWNNSETLEAIELVLAESEQTL